MSTQKAIGISVGMVMAAFLFAFVYQHYSGERSISVETASVKTSKESPSSTKAVTPDTAVDDIIDEALLDRDDLSAEETGEVAEIEAGASAVTDLNTVYEENEIQ